MTINTIKLLEKTIKAVDKLSTELLMLDANVEINNNIASNHPTLKEDLLTIVKNIKTLKELYAVFLLSLKAAPLQENSELVQMTLEQRNQFSKIVSVLFNITLPENQRYGWEGKHDGLLNPIPQTMRSLYDDLCALMEIDKWHIYVPGHHDNLFVVTNSCQDLNFFSTKGKKRSAEAIFKKAAKMMDEIIMAYELEQDNPIILFNLTHYQGNESFRPLQNFLNKFNVSNDKNATEENLNNAIFSQKQEVIRLLKLAKDMGHLQASWVVASSMVEGKLMWHTFSADNQRIDSIYLSTNIDFPQDKVTGIKLLEKIADKTKDKRTAIQVADFFIKHAKTEKAVEWLENAMRFGSQVSAQNRLSQLYENGLTNSKGFVVLEPHDSKILQIMNKSHNLGA